MRIPGLLVLLLLGWLAAAVVSASAQSHSVPPPLSPPPAEKFGLWSQPSTGMAVGEYRLPLQKFGPDYLVMNIQPAQDEVCYTMRSYKVERAERFVDGDGVTGYSTCQSSSGFELKHAVEPVTDSK